MNASNKILLKSRFGILLATLLLSGGLVAQQASPAREYAVPNHGSLRLSVPDTWKVSTKATAEPASVLLHIVPTGNTFDVQLTIAWLDSAAVAKTTSESIKSNVQRSGVELLQQAVEKTLTILDLKGSQTFGSYYALTDRNPGPGEFKYVTQGSFLTGELLSAFTILSSDPNSAEVRQLLQMLGDAAYSKPVRPANSPGAD